MNTGVCSNLWNYCGNSARHDLLWIRLPRINHVINLNAAAEIWPHDLGRDIRVWLSRGNPGDMTVSIKSERLVVKIKPKLTQLPQLIGDVFAGVSYCSIRAHNNLVRLMFISAGM